MERRGIANRQRILDFLRTFIARHGYSPTVREIAEAVGLTSSTVYSHLEVMVRLGQVTRGRQARTPRAWRPN